MPSWRAGSRWPATWRRWSPTRARSPPSTSTCPAPMADRPMDDRPMDDRAAQRRLAHGWRAWALVGAVVVVIVGLAWLTLPKPDKPGPKVVTDSAFVTTANSTCRATIPGLRPVIVTDSTPKAAEIAADV